MKKMKSLVASVSIAALLLGAVPAFAGSSWVTFSTNLPRVQGWTELADDTNNNNSKAQAEISSIGSDYKVNLNVYQGNTKVSSSYNGATAGTTANFTLDSKSQGKTVTLKGQTGSWSVVRVEVSGQFRADTK